MDNQTTASIETSRTARKWLFESIGWTIACMAGWIGVSGFLSINEGYLNTVLLTVLLYISLLMAHGLMWRKAVASGWQLELDEVDSRWLRSVITIWRITLVPFQLACLILGLMGLAFLGAPSNWGGLGF